MTYPTSHASSSRSPTRPVHTLQAHEADVEEEDAFTELPEPTVLPPADLLSNYETINVLAPLVRCSKLPFRHLCSLYETHITHTPMILAQEFSRSQTARISDFSSSVNERGVFWVEPRNRGRSGSSSKGKESVGGGKGEGERELEGTKNHPHKSYQTPQAHDRLPPSSARPTPKSELVRGLLLAQFASPNAASLADAAELIAPYIDGLDINCGCPQKWAFHEGIGCALLRKPELVADMIRCTKDRMGWGWPVSIKIRIDPEEQ